MIANQEAWALINGIWKEALIVGSTAKITEMIKTAVVGGDKFVFVPPSH